MESKSFGENLKDVLIKVQMRTVTITDKEYKNEPVMLVDEAKQAIIDLVKELVPDKMSRWDKLQQSGWNACRQTILDKLK